MFGQPKKQISDYIMLVSTAWAQIGTKYSRNGTSNFQSLLISVCKPFVCEYQTQISLCKQNSMGIH